ncbi:MAG: TlpA disulfide reductase family protein [Pseudomonadota bacterium]
MILLRIPLMSLAFVYLFVLAFSPAQAKEITLDQDRRSALAALPLIEGEDVSAESLSGTPVVLTFFASWCPPCHAEFDHLNAIKQQYGDSVAILAVNIFEKFFANDDGTRLAGFLDKKNPAFRVLGDGEQVGPLFEEVARIPTVFVFDGQGQPVLHFIHAEGATKTHVTFEELEAAVSQALSGSS